MSRRLGSFSLLGFILLAGACASNNSSNTYFGSGSAWRWTISNTNSTSGTFTGAESSTGLSVSGAFTRPSNGLLLLSVDTTSNALRIYPQKYFALDAPGVALFVEPMITGTESQPLVNIAYRACPTAAQTGNWIFSQHSSSSDYSASTLGPFGTFSLAINTGTGVTSVTFPTSYTLDTGYGSVTNSNTVAGTCSSATATSAFGPMYLHSSGVGLLKTTGAEAYLMLPAAAISTASNLDGNYSGIGYDGYSTVTFPFTAVASGGTITTTYLSATDVSTSVGTGPSLTITGLDTPSAGLIEATLTVSATTRNMACLASRAPLSTTRKVIWCVGQSPTQASKPFNLFLVQQPS